MYFLYGGVHLSIHHVYIKFPTFYYIYLLYFIEINNKFQMVSTFHFSNYQAYYDNYKDQKKIAIKHFSAIRVIKYNFSFILNCFRNSSAQLLAKVHILGIYIHKNSRGQCVKS